MRTLLAMVILTGAFAPARAQVQLPTVTPQTQFSTGQDVVPVYEGWLRNKDGTFTFVFGYFNRNWKEELAIPAGPDNKIEPGPPDRGQPTYFLPRRQPWVFRVTVPKDWGQQELVWSITAHGRTEKAYAQLMLEEEILERVIQTRGNLNPGEDDPNKPPTIAIAPVPAASVASPVTLTAMVTDDGLPKPRPVPAPRPGAIPQAQTNNATERPKAGLSVTWMQYGGPAKVTFDSTGPIAVNNGQAVTAAHFTAPGAYVLTATASDGALRTSAQVTITVK
ncbi:MAG TPA: hypothetical protein VK687_12540 [Bryobacteraceae bacterium]|nr:hypothetical protein [Bryobacteraceae bacterium]